MHPSCQSLYFEKLFSRSVAGWMSRCAVLNARSQTGSVIWGPWYCLEGFSRRVLAAAEVQTEVVPSPLSFKWHCLSSQTCNRYGDESFLHIVPESISGSCFGWPWNTLPSFFWYSSSLSNKHIEKILFFLPCHGFLSKFDQLSMNGSCHRPFGIFGILSKLIYLKKKFFQNCCNERSKYSLYVNMDGHTSWYNYTSAQRERRERIKK